MTNGSWVDFEKDKVHAAWFETGKQYARALATYMSLLALGAILVFGEAPDGKVHEVVSKPLE